MIEPLKEDQARLKEQLKTASEVTSDQAMKQKFTPMVYHYGLPLWFTIPDKAAE
jgi:hypothetical protein